MSGGMTTTDVSGKAEVVLTTKGDLATWDTARVRKGVSATNYTGLQADSAIADGLTYGATARSTLDVTGKMLYASSANTLAAITAGAEDTVLTMGASSVPAWAAAAGGGAWTSEGTFTTPDDTSQIIDIDLNNAFDEDKAMLYLTFNGAQADASGQDWEILFNDLTADYAKTIVQSQNGGAIVTGITAGAGEWAIANQYQTDWFSGQAWLYITKNEDDAFSLNGRFEHGGSSASDSKLGNSTYGILYYEAAVTSITSIIFRTQSATQKMKTGTSLSIWSLSKS